MAPRSPLQDVALPAGLCELPFRAQVNVRAELPGLPGPGTAVRDGERTTIWLGPDEWLVTGPPGTAAEIERDLRDAIAATGGWGAVTDVSAQRTTLVLSVRDSGVGLSSSVATQGTRFALQQVRDRLAALYGARATLCLEAAADGGTEARITLPLPTDA